MKNIPIFLTVKTNSVRCPKKNFELLPYSFDYLNRQGLINNTIVIVDTEELEDYVLSLGFKNTWIEDKTICELYSIWNYCNRHNVKYDYVIYFSNTQPFKDPDLIKHGIELIDGTTDLITSYNVTTDRAIYYINEEDFIIESNERKGVMCDSYNMCDGALYVINRKFLKYICSDLDKINGRFWNESKKKFIKNNTVFMDIDTIDDMKQFKNLVKQINDKHNSK